ncbi:MAG: phospholipase C [Mycobacteriaceae bacterium]|nr:phospholipase C [Mycobacteriaceae bacterium]
MGDSPFAGLSRREFLAKVAAAGGTAFLASWAEPVIEKAYAMGPSQGSLNDIEHIVLFMQENRSFDHYFGTLSGVEGFGHDPANPNPAFLQKGWNPQTRTVDPNGVTIPFRLDTTNGPSLTGECINDPDHTWIGMHEAYNGGGNDHWLPMSAQSRSVGNVPALMGYYQRQDIPIHYLLADAFTICDHYHCSLLGPTMPNRLYWLSATINPEGDKGGPMLVQPTVLPKLTYSWRIMPENLQDAGVTWKVYDNKALGPINQVIFDGLVGSFKQAADPNSQLFLRGIAPTYPVTLAADVAANTLPQVSWVVPPVIECEHPALPAAVGAVGIVNLLRILTSNPQVWEKTAVIVSYDENGGFFDHVTPPTAPPGTSGEYIADSVDVNSVTGSGGIRGPIGLGYRVPCFVISPYSRGGLVAHETFDHTSQLRLVGRRFNVPVPNLTAWRASVTGDMTSAFNFAANPDSSHPDWGAPLLRALPGLPLCLPNAVLGTANLGIPDPVPYPQTMPVQETTPSRGTPSG